MPIHVKWKVKEDRIEAIRKLVVKLKKPANKITARDFWKNGLSWIMNHYYQGSSRRALIDAGYDVKAIVRKPRNYWKLKENRIKAVRDMVSALRKSPKKITYNDFHRHSLTSLFIVTGPYKQALQEAGYNVVYKKKVIKPPNYWKKAYMRRSEIRKLVRKLKKPPYKITRSDFIANGLGTLIKRYCSLTRALNDAGFDVHRTFPGHWKSKENRINALKNAVKNSGKDPREINRPDMVNLGLRGLINKYYHGNTKHALLDAGLITADDLPLKRGYWQIRNNRIQAIHDLVSLYGNDPSKIRITHFYMHHLRGLMNHYKNSVRTALIDAGYKREEINKNRDRPWGYWDIKENRVNATKELIHRLGKPHDEITEKDFISNGLMTLMEKYTPKKCKNFEKGEILTFSPGYLLEYRNPVERALTEAGFSVQK